MARINTNLLDTNDKFPELGLQLVNGETIKLPDDIGDVYAVFLIYRGYW